MSARTAGLCGKIESMKILAFEYACAGGPGGNMFLDEGRLMLISLLEELAEFGHITTLVNRALDTGGITADETVAIDGDFYAAVKKRMESADVVWIIAPECGGALYRLTDMAERLGKTIPGSSAEAVKLCGDKLSLYSHLNGTVPMPESEPFTDDFSDFPCVVKPVDGAGCENIFFMTDAKTLREIKTGGENYLIEPYVEGERLSAAIVNNGGGPILLGVCRQVIEQGPRLKFKKLLGPIEYANRDKLIGMIKKVCRLIPGLAGYFGIDFIDCDGRLTLIEINPRLTTSYPIYAGTCGFNIAQKALGATHALKAV